MAVIINSIIGNDGIVVTVGKFIGDVPDFYPGDRWYVDPPITARKGGTANHHPGSWLLRIDGYEETEKSEEKAEA